jgi:hypothetical protein
VREAALAASTPANGRAEGRWREFERGSLNPTEDPVVQSREEPDLMIRSLAEPTKSAGVMKEGSCLAG